MIGLITPAYNAGRFINEALYSLTLQNIDDFTLFVTDDGSEDGTVDIIRNYEGQVGINLNIFPEHRGVAHAFNDALARCIKDKRVDHIARMDADDYLFYFTLQVLEDHLIKTGADLVYGDHLLYEYNEELKAWFNKMFSMCPSDPPTAGQLIRGRNAISGGGIMVNRAALNRLDNPGWDPDMKGGWEQEWYIRLLITGSVFRKIPATVYVHRAHDDSMFAESISGTRETSRWMSWHRQLWERSPVYREAAILVQGVKDAQHNHTDI